MTENTTVGILRSEFFATYLLLFKAKVSPHLLHLKPSWLLLLTRVQSSSRYQLSQSGFRPTGGEGERRSGAQGIRPPPLESILFIYLFS